MTTLKYSDIEVTFTTSNCAILGANGKGKSSLSKIITSTEYPSKVFISAQRNLSINQGRLRGTKDEVLIQQQNSFTSSDGGVHLAPTDNNFIQSDFDQNLEKMIREDVNLHANASRIHNPSNHVYVKPSTKADEMFKIWNNIFIDKNIHINESGKIFISNIPKKDTDIDYQIENLSDGERSALYMIIKCISAPGKALIVVDEAETHLNQSLLQDLWDEIEENRSDCCFLYISHNIEFIVSRKNCTKYWIESFTHPLSWKLAEIENNTMPEELVMQIIGTKKEKILFVESKESSNICDKKLYQKIYPDFKVFSVNSCSDVEKFTKSLNISTQNYSKKYFGLIDRDYKTDEEITLLKSSKIFVTPTAEFEGLFYLESIVRKYLDIIQVADVESAIVKLKNDLTVMLSSDDYKKTFYKKKVRAQFYSKVESLDLNSYLSLQFKPDTDTIEIDFQSRNSNCTDIETLLKYVNTKEIKNIKVNNHSGSTYQAEIIEKLNENNSLLEEFKKLLPTIS